MDVRTKLEISDIDGYDWNWVAKYEDEIIAELVAAYTASFVLELPAIPVASVQQIAAEWAREKAATLIQGVAETTKTRVRQIVGTNILEGASIQTIRNQIQDDFIFSRKRANLVARTETTFALGQGQKGAAIAEGRDEKRWTTSGDVDDECLGNEKQGWIAIDEPFASGDDTIPAHPNCRCVVRYRTKALSEDAPTIVTPESSELMDIYQDPNIERSFDRVELFRCVGCNKLLGKHVASGTKIQCRRCKAERIA